MKKRNNISVENIITPKALLTSLFVVVLWWVFWLGPKALFMIEVPFLTSWLLSSDPRANFVSLTLWVAAISLVALAIWHWLERDYSFLKMKDKWDILAYVIPALLIVILLVTKSTTFNVPMWIYIIAMLVTNFCQELLTTGFMQTGLSKRLGSIVAAVVTCVMFYLGHFMIAETLTPTGGIMILGFILFSWLRYRRGNIYLANVIHLSWSLIMVFI